MSDIDRLAPEINNLDVNDAVEPANWSNLPVEVKGMIVKKMNIITRIKLKRCSKSDKQLVDSIPMHIKKMRLLNYAYIAYFHQGTVNFNFRCGRNFEMDGLRVFKHSIRLRMCQSSVVDGQHDPIEEQESERRDIRASRGAVEKRFVDIFSSEKHLIDCFDVAWECPRRLKVSKALIHARTVLIRSEQHCIDWLKHISPDDIETIIVMPHEENQVIYDYYLTLMVDMDDEEIGITNDLIVKFDRKKLNLRYLKISEVGINELIKKWIAENYPIGSTMEIRTYYAKELEKILDDINYIPLAMNNCTLSTFIPMTSGKRMKIFAKINNSMMILKVEVLENPSMLQSFQRLFTNTDKYKVRNWNDMPFEIKDMIVNYMDLVTRTKLKMCSKNDKYLVEHTPFHFNRIGVEANNISFDGFYIKSIGYQSDIVHVYNGNKCIKQLHYPSYQEAEKWLEKLLQNLIKNARIGEFSVKKSALHVFDTIRTKSVSIEYSGAERCMEWINRVAPNCKIINIDCDFELLEDLWTNPMFVNADRLHISDNNIKDDDIFNFRATDLSLGPSQLTAQGIVNFIMKVIIKNQLYPTVSFQCELARFQQLDEVIDQLREIGLDVEEGRNERYKIKMSDNKYLVFELNGRKFCLSMILL